VDTTNQRQKQNQETQQLTELLSFLYLALKNIQLYPIGHSMVKNRLAIAHQLLSRILINRKTILFGVARNVITYDGDPIGADSQACTAFARVLSRHEVASMAFSYGVMQHSLFLLLKAVGVLPEQNQSGKNLQQQLSSLNLPHIDVEIINYDYFDRSAETDSPQAAAAPLTWLSFTQKLTSGILGFSGKSEATGSRMAAPEALAAALNRQAGRQPEIIELFSSLLDQMLQQDSRESLTSASFGGREFSKIIASLNPELRTQFLNTTLERCDRNMVHNSPEKLLETFSDTVVLDMIRQINKKKVQVSPALLNLIRKISKIRFTAEPTTPGAIARQREIDNLLDPESYNINVSEKYHDTLQNLAAGPAAPTPQQAAFPLEEHLQTLEESHLNRQIVRATLLFMHQTDDALEYQSLAEKLIEICLVLPDNGAFNLLQTTVKLLRKQARNKKSESIRKTAEASLEKLTSLDFLDYIYSILPEKTEEERRAAAGLFNLLCPDILDKLLTIFSMSQKVSEDDLLVIIFKVFRLETLTRVFTVLPKTKTSNTLLKLLTLIEYLGIQGTVRLLHPFLDHEDPAIRIRILGLLLPIHDKEAGATLASMLESKNENTVNTAIELCETHRPAACVPGLINLMEYQFIKQTSIERNKRLFMILSNIGDSRALPALEKIAFTKWPFHRDQVMTMKRILFYSLKGYPPHERKNLLKKGLQLKDKEILKICDALLPDSHGHGGKA